MKTTIWVTAAPGLRCPMERNPRRYITGSVPVEVKATPFYQRLLADGSLVEAKKPALPRPQAQTERKKTAVRADKKEG